MKKIMFFIISFVLVILLISGTFGAPNNTYTDMQGGSAGDFITGGGNTVWPYPYVSGIRVSFVNSEGKNLASRDYIYDDDYELIKDQLVLVTEDMCSRPGYNYSSSCSSTYSSSPSKVSSFASKLSNFQKFSTVNFDGGTYKFSFNVETAVYNLNYTGLFDSLYKNKTGLTSDKYSKAITAFFNSILSSYGIGNLDKYSINGTGQYDIFMVVEQTTVVKMTGKLYYGTTYELNKQGLLEPGGNYSGTSTECKNSPNGATCDLGKLVRKALPCSSYVDGRIYDEMQKLNFPLIKYFSENSYFNGGVTINTAEANRVCSSPSGVGEQYFNPREAANTLGIGIGVVWPTGLLNGDGPIGPSCDTVNEFYKNQNLSSSLSCSTIDKFDFSAFNKKYASLYNMTIDSNWYKTNCGCGGKEENSYNCTPEYNIGKCLESDQVYYKDSSKGILDEEYWNNCVFNDNGKYDIEINKESNKNSNYTYYEEALGDSEFCEVYCIEELETNFPLSYGSVEAGRYFYWGEGSVEGSRTCRTKEIKWDSFYKQLEQANIDIERAFNKYLVARDQQASINKYRGDNDCGGDCIKCDDDGDGKKDECCGYTEEWDSYKVEWSGAEYGFGNTYVSGKEGSRRSCDSYPTKDFDVDGKYQDYLDIKNDAIALYERMLKCYNWDDDSIYNLNPSGEIIYGDGVYDYKGSLVFSDTDYDEDENLDCTNTDVVVLTSCSDSTSSCTKKTYKIKKCNSVTITRSGESNFELEDGIFQYILKKGPTSVNIIKDFEENYLNLGFSNFPVSFAATDGPHGTMYGNGALDIQYSNLGHMKNNKTAVDDILKSIDSDYGNWQCQFTVNSKLIPEEPDNPNNPNNPGGGSNGFGGIDLVYRTIDLVNPFPDIDGGMRNTGSNWCALDDCSYNNSVVQSYINNNRDVNDYELYSQEPMYTIILTPKIIKEIRRFNEANTSTDANNTEGSYGSYGGSLDGKTYNYTCNKGTGEACISDYFSHIIDITGAKDLPGTCVDDKYRNYNDIKNFNACRY